MLPAISPDVQPPCTNDPGMWFSTDRARVASAKARCMDCPIRRRCAEIAAADVMREGVYGGFDTSNARDWRDLEQWVGVDASTRQRRRAQRLYTCEDCGNEFTRTRPPPRRARCWACGSGLTDPQSTRQHLEQLRAAGESLRSISIRAGLAPNTAAAVARSDKWIQKGTSKAILALDPLKMAVMR